jgi:hypothetical protein
MLPDHLDPILPLGIGLSTWKTSFASGASRSLYGNLLHVTRASGYRVARGPRGLDLVDGDSAVASGRHRPHPSNSHRPSRAAAQIRNLRISPEMGQGDVHTGNPGSVGQRGEPLYFARRPARAVHRRSRYYCKTPPGPECLTPSHVSNQFDYKSLVSGRLARLALTPPR